MKAITPIRHEQDFTALQAGDHVLVNNRPYMLRKRSVDGAELVRAVNPGEVHMLHVRGYSITAQGGILPVWYSEKTIQLRSQEVQR